MKIAAILATRGRPAQAKTMLDVARMLASGKHDIEYIVSIDDDDAASVAFDFGARTNIGPRPIGIGACWNRCVALTDAEVIVTLTDDGVVGAHGWDQIIVENMTAPGVLAWNDTASPGQASNLIVTRQWIEEVGYFLDERFPFWFSDTAINEIHSFVTGQCVTIPQSLLMVHNGRMSNPRLRDMDLWWRLYGVLRAERLEIAKGMRERLGLPEPTNLEEMRRMWEQRDVIGLPSSQRIAEQLPPRDPDDAYLRAKDAALKYLADKKPTIGLCMIVKDEASIIRRCLHTVLPLIDHWTIVDTGSTDGTQDIIRSFFDEVAQIKKIPGELHERPWQDFAHNRSEALALARPKADYSLIIDADDVLMIPEGFAMPNLTKDNYHFDIHYGNVIHRRQQLVKNTLPWCYKGVLHEFLTCEGEKTEGHIPLVIRCGTDGARRKDPKRFVKDAAILEKAIADETDPQLIQRNTFYLGQSWRDAGEHEKSIEAYLRRADQGGWIEEVYISLVWAARQMVEKQYPDYKIVQTFGRATAVSVGRAEAWHGLAKFYRDAGRFGEGYLACARGLVAPQPDAGLFLEPWVYQYGLLDEFSVCAFYAGHYDQSLQTCEALLKRSGSYPEEYKARIEANAKFARDKMAEKAA